tara:strand:- start:101 stop:391 length:291 start_codon:yes stop_codon:yes gene_type:complete
VSFDIAKSFPLQLGYPFVRVCWWNQLPVPFSSTFHPETSRNPHLYFKGTSVKNEMSGQSKLFLGHWKSMMAVLASRHAIILKGDSLAISDVVAVAQ